MSTNKREAEWKNGRETQHQQAMLAVWSSSYNLHFEALYRSKGEDIGGVTESKRNMLRGSCGKLHIQNNTTPGNEGNASRQELQQPK